VKVCFERAVPDRRRTPLHRYRVYSFSFHVPPVPGRRPPCSNQKGYGHRIRTGPIAGMRSEICLSLAIT